MPEIIYKKLDSLNDLLPRLASAADDLEKDPYAWQQVWSDPRVRAISYLGVPDHLNPYPFKDSGLGLEYGHALHLALVERLSRGSASVMMALPASALSTRAVLQLGTEAQINQFFAPFMQGPAWTFFAVTEPSVGSDASQIRSTLTRKGSTWRLHGHKTLVGGAALASRGLVLAKEEDTGILRLVVIGQAADDLTFSASKLLATGLAGAGISDLHFRDFEIDSDDVLALDSRHPVMLTLSNVFESHRPMVGAMALGTTRAILDRLDELGAKYDSADLRLDHEILLRRMLRLGAQADNGSLPIYAVSQFKRQATELAEAMRQRLVRDAPDFMLQDNRLRRLWRDISAFEYMEGTSAIHRLNAFRGYVVGDYLNDLEI